MGDCNPQPLSLLENTTFNIYGMMQMKCWLSKFGWRWKSAYCIVRDTANILKYSEYILSINLKRVINISRCFKTTEHILLVVDVAFVSGNQFYWLLPVENGIICMPYIDEINETNGNISHYFLFISWSFKIWNHRLSLWSNCISWKTKHIFRWILKYVLNLIQSDNEIKIWNT